MAFFQVFTTLHNECYSSHKGEILEVHKTCSFPYAIYHTKDQGSKTCDTDSLRINTTHLRQSTDLRKRRKRSARTPSTASKRTTSASGVRSLPKSHALQTPPLLPLLPPRATTATVSNASWVCLKQKSKT
jgi:hypothetical protein